MCNAVNTPSSICPTRKVGLMYLSEPLVDVSEVCAPELSDAASDSGT